MADGTFATKEVDFLLNHQTESAQGKPGRQATGLQGPASKDVTATNRSSSLPLVDDTTASVFASSFDGAASALARKAVLADLHAERARVMRVKRLEGLSKEDELYLSGLISEIDSIEAHATRERRRHEAPRNAELAELLNKLVSVQAAIEANKIR